MVVCLAGVLAKAQTPPADWAVKNIQFASYAVTKQKDAVNVSFYANINSAGDVNMAFTGGNANSYYTCTMPLEERAALAEIFNSQQPLKTFATGRGLVRNEHYAGEYYFIFVQYNNGKTDKISLIKSLMSKKFNDSFTALTNIFYGRQKKASATQFMLPPTLNKALLHSYKATPNLPHIEEPPPMAAKPAA